MKTTNLWWNPALLLLSLFCVLCVASLNAVQWVTAADPSRHPPAGGNGDSSNPLISADGRFVLFASVADNLVVAGSNAPLAASLLAQFNVFLRNRSNRVTALVSLNLSYLVDRAANTSKLMGAVRPGSHVGPRFSADGRYLAYVTSSANVTADTNGLPDVYLYDCQTSSNTLVSQAYVAPASANGASDSHLSPASGQRFYRVVAQ